MDTNLKIEDELLKMNSRLDKVQVALSGVQKQLDLLNGDRNILETIQSRLTAVEEQQRVSRENDNNVRKDIKEEINIVGDKIGAMVETQIEGVRSVVKNRKANFKKAWWKWW